MRFSLRDQSRLGPLGFVPVIEIRRWWVEMALELLTWIAILRSTASASIVRHTAVRTAGLSWVTITAI